MQRAPGMVGTIVSLETKSKILHFHIPKTAGTALREFFCEQLGSDRVSPALSGLRLGDALLRWSHFDVITGHFNAYQGDGLPEDRICLTALRNPVDRFLSEFFFWKNNNDMRLLNARFRGLGLESYIESLESEDAARALVQLEMLCPLGAESAGNLTPEEKLAAAKRALDEFDLVGTQDELEDFSCMIEAYMGWPRRSLPHTNVTRQRMSIDDLSQIQRHTIERLLQPEIELYRHARTRFQRDRRTRIASWTGHIADLSQQLPPDRQIDAAREPRIRQVRNFGDGRCKVAMVVVSGAISGRDVVIAGERANIEVHFAVLQPVEQINVGVAIRDESGALMYGTNSRLLGNNFALGIGEYSAVFSFFNRLGIGSYSIDCSLIRTNSHHDDCYHWVEQAARFEVYEAMSHFFEGRVLLDVDFQLTAESANATSVQMRAQLLDLELRTFGRTNEPLLEFASSMQLMTKINSLSRGIDALVPLRLKNTSTEAWRISGRNPVSLSYRWYSAAGALVVEDGLRTPLPNDFSAGDAAIVSLQVRTPDEAGDYHLLISPVQELVAWFVDQNAASALVVAVSVR